MKHQSAIKFLVAMIAFFALLVTSYGIFYNQPNNTPYMHRTVRGETVEIYGKGLYHHMTSDVAIMGIAQDYITLFVAVPLLLFSFVLWQKGNPRGKLLLAGTLLYFLLTYLFYTAMAMFNFVFIYYVALLGLSLFTFLLVLTSYTKKEESKLFHSDTLMRKAGIFLIINAALIGLLWLSAILPSLLSGTIYPEGLAHYTTMIVQGFDLGIFLPLAIVSGAMAIKKQPFGYLFTSVYMVFLSVLMASLFAKLVFMANAGYETVPAIIIIPVLWLVSLVFAIKILKQVPSK
jgi:hypothetical protein